MMTNRNTNNWLSVIKKGAQMRKITAITTLIFVLILIATSCIMPIAATFTEANGNTSASQVLTAHNTRPIIISDANKESNLLTVTFLDVGQADATLIQQGSSAMLIDGGNTSNSNLIYTALRDRGISHLDYIVATHAHADHVGGLSGALTFATVGVVYSPVKEYDTRAFSNFIRSVDRRGVKITIPTPGGTFMLGDAEVMVLGPSVINEDDPNDASIVLKITHGDISFLFTGDAERNAELRLLDEKWDLPATVLKVGHHGSNTSTIYPFLREVMPKYAVISSGKGNPYGHPHEPVLSRLRDADVTVFRTDMQGDIVAVSDGRNVSFTTERNAGTQTNTTESQNAEPFYIGNTNSRKFHQQTCNGLPAERNRVIINTLEEAYSQGFDPCGTCRP